MLLEDISIWMKIVWSDYSRDTTSLSLQEHGAYFILMREYWINRGALKADINRLYRACGAMTQSEKDSVLFILNKYFIYTKDGKYLHKRIEAELAEATEFKRKKSEAGKKGMESRYNKATNTVTNTVITELVTNNLTEGITNAQQKPNPSPSPLPKVRKDPLTPQTEIVDNSVDKVKKGSFSEDSLGFRSGSWNVLEYLSLDGDTQARESAKIYNWDYNILVEKYNAFQNKNISDGKKPPPLGAKADKAFNNWIPSFTKRRPPS